MSSRVDAVLQALGHPGPVLASLEGEGSDFILLSELLLFQHAGRVRRITLHDLKRIHSDAQGRLLFEARDGQVFGTDLHAFEPSEIPRFFNRVQAEAARTKALTEETVEASSAPAPSAPAGPPTGPTGGPVVTGAMINGTVLSATAATAPAAPHTLPLSYPSSNPGEQAVITFAAQQLAARRSGPPPLSFVPTMPDPAAVPVAFTRLAVQAQAAQGLDQRLRWLAGILCAVTLGVSVWQFLSGATANAVWIGVSGCVGAVALVLLSEMARLLVSVSSALSAAVRPPEPHWTGSEWIAEQSTEQVQLARLMPLFLGQALAAGTSTVSMMLAGVVMQHMGFPALAGLPSALINLAAGLAAGIFGSLMVQRGRRLGLGLAFGLGVLGAIAGFIGASQQQLWLFLLGSALLGAAQGGHQQARYALIEHVPESKRGSALGMLMLMNVLGAFALTGAARPIEQWAVQLRTTPEITGWLAGALLMGLATVLILFWRPQHAPAQAASKPKLSLREALRTPGVPSTMLALSVSHGLMVSLMTLTPVRADHLGVAHSGLLLLNSGHLMGMFGFGWLSGPMIDRWGLRFGYSAGSLLLIAAALTSPLNSSVWLGISMFLLGLGWNLGYVSASKAIGRIPSAQGVADGFSYLSACLGTLLGGLVVARWGFAPLAYAGAGLSLLLIFSAVRVRATPKPG